MMAVDTISSRRPASAAVGALARRESRRVIRHPVYLVFLAYFAVLALSQVANSPFTAQETAQAVVRIFGVLGIGPATFFAANLVASSARRSHAESQLAAAPTSEQARTLAICAGLLAPTVAASGIAVLLWLVEHSGGTLADAQRPAELAAIPLCTLGGGLLGVAVALWLPWRGAALLAFGAVFAWVVAVLDHVDLRWTAPWTMSDAYTGGASLPVAGSETWHAVYLLGLGLLAGVAAVLRFRSHRRPLFALGLALLAATIAGGVAQLP